MIARFLLPALIAGVLAGLFATAVQSYRVIPLILQAETYENAGDGGHSHETSHDATAAAEHGHDSAHDSTGAKEASTKEAWAPQDGLERVFYTGVSNVLVGVAFAMLLVTVVLLTNSAVTLRTGLVWGAAGFVTFVLAPNFGLPPELPGMDAADLVSRQIWWFATVVATGAALYLFAFKPQPIWIAFGVLLLAAPHLIGAPMPTSHESVVPSNLAAEFATATIVSSLLFWLVLGGLFGWLANGAKTRAAAAS